MPVLVIGAGIGGITAALALRQRGIDVEIYERSAALADVAAEYGRQVGRRARARNGGSRLLTALNVIGYEPATSGDDVVLRNCPFRHVAQARPEIICQMNLAFVAGVLAGTQSRSLHAVLSPSTERCCVVVTS